MFVYMKRTTIMAALVAAGASAPLTAIASETIPLTVTLTDVQMTDVPLYISVQTKAEYRSMNGIGAVLKTTEGGTIVETVTVPEPGDYAITVWHDLDNDGRFSMNERYEIEDGWATSGEVPRGAAPTFDQAKITVPAMGTSASVTMIYPES